MRASARGRAHRARACAVAGIDRYPRKITRDMGKKKLAKRSKLKAFVKSVNYNHIMPTRYMLDVSEQLKSVLGDETLASNEKRHEARKDVKVRARARTWGPALREGRGRVVGRARAGAVGGVRRCELMGAGRRYRRPSRTGIPHSARPRATSSRRVLPTFSRSYASESVPFARIKVCV